QNWWNTQQQMTNLFPGLSLPIPQVTPQGASVFLPWTAPMNDALVGSAATYLTQLAPLGHQQLRAGLSTVVAPQPLLYRLARHALLLEYGWTARRALQNAGILSAADRLEPELVDVSYVPSQTVWRHLDRPLQILGPGPTLGQFLDNPANESLPECAGLGS